MNPVALTVLPAVLVGLRTLEQMVWVGLCCIIPAVGVLTSPSLCIPSGALLTWRALLGGRKAVSIRFVCCTEGLPGHRGPRPVTLAFRSSCPHLLQITWLPRQPQPHQETSGPPRGPPRGTNVGPCNAQRHYQGNQQWAELEGALWGDEGLGVQDRPGVSIAPPCSLLGLQASQEPVKTFETQKHVRWL